MTEKNNGQPPFRLAVVGVGLISTGAHLPAAMGLPEASIAALVDPMVERASAIAREFGLSCRTAAHLDEVLGDIDGAVIATPNFLHADLALRCLDSGVHVLIEKPLATTLPDCQRIVDAAKAAKLVAALGYTTRFRDNVMLLHRLLRDETFGRPQSFAYQFGTAGGWPSVSAYSLDAKATGGGVVMVSGTHFIDRMLWWFGYPDRFTYVDDSRGGPEANAICRFEFLRQGSPLRGAARFSKTTALTGGQVIETDRGRLVLREVDNAPVVFHPKENPELTLVVEDDRPSAFSDLDDVFQRQLRDFITACRSGASPMCVAEQGLASQRLIEALYGERTQIDDDWYAPAKARLKEIA